MYIAQTDRMILIDIKQIGNESGTLFYHGVTEPGSDPSKLIKKAFENTH